MAVQVQVNALAIFVNLHYSSNIRLNTSDYTTCTRWELAKYYVILS